MFILNASRFISPGNVAKVRKLMREGSGSFGGHMSLGQKNWEAGSARQVFVCSL